jgi:hypothetical protein
LKADEADGYTFAHHSGKGGKKGGTGGVVLTVVPTDKPTSYPTMSPTNTPTFAPTFATVPSIMIKNNDYLKQIAPPCETKTGIYLTGEILCSANGKALDEVADDLRSTLDDQKWLFADLYLKGKHDHLNRAFDDLKSHCNKPWSLGDWVYSFYNKFPATSNKRCVSFVSASKFGFRMRFSDRPDKEMKSNNAFYQLDITPKSAALSRFAAVSAGGDGNIQFLTSSSAGASYSNDDLFSSHFMCFTRAKKGTSVGWDIVYGASGAMAFATQDLFVDGSKLQHFDPTMFAFASVSGTAEITNIQLIIDPDTEKYCKLLGIQLDSNNDFFVQSVAPSFANPEQTWASSSVLVSGTGFATAAGCVKYVCTWTRSDGSTPEIIDAVVVDGVAGRAITCATPSSGYTQTCDCSDTSTFTVQNRCEDRCKITEIFTCRSCPAGTYKTWGDGFNGASCIDCPSGRFQMDTERERCVPCARGSYADAPGSRECIKCPVGQYGGDLQSGGSSVATGCTMCPSSKYQSEPGQANCIQCEGGRFQDHTGQGDCKTCPTGYHRSISTNMASCIGCAAGYYNPIVEQPTCKTCPRGKYAAIISVTTVSSASYAPGVAVATTA